MKAKALFIIDGNDGTGKTEIVTRLRAMGFRAGDRGLPCKIVDTDSMKSEGPLPSDEIYIILDVPPAVSLERLRKRGADPSDPYHSEDSLSYYQPRYRQVCVNIGGILVDASGSIEEVLNTILVRAFDELCERLAWPPECAKCAKVSRLLLDTDDIDVVRHLAWGTSQVPVTSESPPLAPSLIARQNEE